MLIMSINSHWSDLTYSQPLLGWVLPIAISPSVSFFPKKIVVFPTKKNSEIFGFFFWSIVNFTIFFLFFLGGGTQFFNITKFGGGEKPGHDLWPNT